LLIPLPQRKLAHALALLPPAQEGESNEILELFLNVPGEIAYQTDTVPAGKKSGEELAKALSRYLNE